MRDRNVTIFHTGLIRFDILVTQISMKQSNLFTKTRKDAPKDEVSKNAQLLIRAGFIHKEMAGAYALLPLGMRVVEKIKSIVGEEMDRIGGKELLMTTLQRKELWEVTDRWDDEKVDVWFKSKLASGKEVGFGWSHEEPISEMMKQYVESYKDLPVYVYQFQNKLRNELRAKSGILRGREFIMKDMYSYTLDAKQHQQFYDSTIRAYHNVFNRVGLGDITYLTYASGGAFTEFSHEFQTISDVGEDTIYVSKDKDIAINEEVYSEKVLADLGLSEGELKKMPSIEVGNIFDFGTVKSEQMGLKYADAKGHPTYVHLGSYGIGITRLMGTIVEIFSDDAGIIWPEEVAPFKVHLVSIYSAKNEGTLKSVEEKSQHVYDMLKEKGIDVLWDDRTDPVYRAGVKFADADLIGCPYRVVVSAKTGDRVEVKRRGDADEKVLDLQAFLASIG